MTLKKLLLAIAGAAAVLGSFLPWVTMSASVLGITVVSVSTNAFGGISILCVILAIIAILCGAAAILLNVLQEKQIKKYIKIKNLEKFPLFIGIAMTAVAVIAFLNIMIESSWKATVSFGVWLIAIAGVATIVLSLIKNKELDKVVFGQPAKAEKSEKPAKKEATKKK